MRFARILLFLVISVSSNATNYYISSAGNDKNSGSKSAPWLTLGILEENSSKFFRGDSIFFERGSTFKGQLKIPGSGIFIGAYGHGANPIFDGSIRLLQWTRAGANVWKAMCPTWIAAPGDVFLNGTRQALGRYPNNGFLLVADTSQHALSAAKTDLQFSNDYWNGAVLVVRSSRWTLDQLTITSYKDKTYRYRENPSYPVQPGIGYFIQNHVSALDQPGEWAFNPFTKELFLFLESGVTPMQQKVEISAIEVGVSGTNRHDVVIDNLTFKGYTLAGVSIVGCNNVRIHQVEVFVSAGNGMDITGCQYPQVVNNLIVGSHNNGVNWHNNSMGKFADNIIRRTGMVPGRGSSGNGTYIGLSITSDEATQGISLFQHNSIDSTGYSGIDFRTGHTEIRNNSITHFCMVKDDGGGVYTWGNKWGNNIIVENIIADGAGTGAGTVHSTQLFASGIYIDDLSENIVVMRNTIRHCATAGIFLHNASHIRVEGNNLNNNGYFSNKEKGQLYIKFDALGKGNPGDGLIITKNKLCTSEEASYCLFVSDDTDTPHRVVGNFAHNEYAAVDATHAVAQLKGQNGICFAPEELTLKDWQETQGELGSSFETLTRKAAVTENNLILNGNLTRDASGWMTWPEKSTIEWVKTNPTDYPSLKISIAQNTDALLYHAGFSLTKKKLYRLSFSVRGTRHGKLEFVPLMSEAPWLALGDYACFTFDSTRKTFVYFFRPLTDGLQARVNFKSNSTFWIDHVSLSEVE